MIVHYSRPLRLDPYAVAAVSRVEGGGRFGEVGDGGTSFGPFQLHVGGALPAGRNAAWANSAAGVAYAMTQMAHSGAAGLRGLPAVRAIVYRFERPAAPGPEVANAWSGYKSYGSYSGGGGGGGGGMGGGGLGGGNFAVWQRQQMAQMQAANAKQLAQLRLMMQRQQKGFQQSLITQAAQARQASLSQQIQAEAQQRVDSGRAAQQSLNAGGSLSDSAATPVQALFDQRKLSLDDIRRQAMRRAGLG